MVSGGGECKEIAGKRERLLNKQKWMSKKDFVSYVGGKQNMLGAKDKYSDGYFVAAEACEERGVD